MPLPLDSGVEGRVLRGGILRIPSGPEGSSGKQTFSGRRRLARPEPLPAGTYARADRIGGARPCPQLQLPAALRPVQVP